jgi:hypothetical protein
VQVTLLEDRALLADVTAPTTTVSAIMGRPGDNGFYTSPVTIDLSATDPDDAPSSLTTQFRVNDAPFAAGNTITLANDGIYTVQYFSTDPAGNVEPTHSLTVKIDRTAPRVTVGATPTTLWPSNGRLVPVTVTGRATDNLSGVSAVAFHVVDEYGRVQPSGMRAVQSDGTYSFTVRLQARRAGQDKDGRQYTIDVATRDLAGNVTMRSFVVTVPHDMGQHNGSNGGGQGGGGQKGEGGQQHHGPRGPRQKLGRGHSRNDGGQDRSGDDRVDKGHGGGKGHRVVIDHPGDDNGGGQGHGKSKGNGKGKGRD